MTRRVATIFVVLALLLSGGLTSCLAAIDNARALECCSKECPRSPAHNPSQCCAVGTSTQDGEVAPATRLTRANISAVSLGILQASAVTLPIAASRAVVQLPDCSPPPREVRNSLCSLLI